MDIEVAVKRGGGSGLAALHGYKNITVPLQHGIELIPFGRLQVPAPVARCALLAQMYGPGYSKRLYRNSAGQLSDVPGSYPRRLLPHASA